MNKTEKRHEQILNLLLTNELINVKEFCDYLKCSESTIRNDLRYLEEKKLIKRTFGGAISTGNTAVNSSVNMRSTVFMKQKLDIAEYITDNILSSGMIIALDAGSTNTILAQKIISTPLDLTVVTNSYSVASILVMSEKIKLYLIGGKYDTISSCFIDETASRILESIRLDIFFLSPNGISLEAGLTIPDPKEAVIKQFMIKSASRTIAVADHSKFGKIGFKIIADFNSVGMIITDEEVDKKELAKIEKAGAKIILAPALK